MRTTLECIQEVCRRLGKPPVSSRDEGGISLAGHVERALDDASISVQSQGWFWNTKRDVTVTPSDGNIRVDQLEDLNEGVGIANYATIFHVDTDGQDSDVNVVRNGNFLYDLTENSRSFSGSLRIQYTYGRLLDQVPSPFQEWIIALAALNYNRQNEQNRARDEILQMEVADARRKSIREEVRTSDINFLDTAETRQFRGRPRMTDRSIR